MLHVRECLTISTFTKVHTRAAFILPNLENGTSVPKKTLTFLEAVDRQVPWFNILLDSKLHIFVALPKLYVAQISPVENISIGGNACAYKKHDAIIGSAGEYIRFSRCSRNNITFLHPSTRYFVVCLYPNTETMINVNNRAANLVYPVKISNNYLIIYAWCKLSCGGLIRLGSSIRKTSSTAPLRFRIVYFQWRCVETSITEINRI